MTFEGAFQNIVGLEVEGANPRYFTAFSSAGGSKRSQELFYDRRSCSTDESPDDPFPNSPNFVETHEFWIQPEQDIIFSAGVTSYSFGEVGDGQWLRTGDVDLEREIWTAKGATSQKPRDPTDLSSGFWSGPYYRLEGEARAPQILQVFCDGSEEVGKYDPDVAVTHANHTFDLENDPIPQLTFTGTVEYKDSNGNIQRESVTDLPMKLIYFYFEASEGEETGSYLWVWEEIT